MGNTTIIPAVYWFNFSRVVDDVHNVLVGLTTISLMLPTIHSYVVESIISKLARPI